MALWGGLGQAATVAQLVGVDIGGLISMIMQAAVTAQQNKKECDHAVGFLFSLLESRTSCCQIAMALWGGLGQAATVAQLVGADVGGLISMIIQAAMTAQQNKKECEQLARRVFMIAELLQHLQDPEVLQRPEIRRPLAGLDDTLREAHELVMVCQEKNAVYRLVMAGRQADRFRDVQSKIDSYLFVFPIISHIDVTRRLDRIYNILVPNDTSGTSTSVASIPQLPIPTFQDAAMIDWKKPHEVQEFDFKELAKATSNFAPDRKIGEGSFGRVYVGRLPDGREVAIKQLKQLSATSWWDGKVDFMTEITILSPIRYKHIVPLYGYCMLVREKRQLLPPFRKKKDEEHLIVYEYMANSSLDLHLYGSMSSPSPVTTSWKMRIEILLGVSRAIQYLQSYTERPVIHNDIKPSNILLDASWTPRLTDFGSALPWEGPDHIVDCVYGSIGYLAPDTYVSGALNLTTDIYSLGVVMLVVLTGKKAYYTQEPEETREEQDEEKREECEEEEHKKEKCTEKEEEREECEEEEPKRNEWKEKEEEGEESEEKYNTEESDKKYNSHNKLLVTFALPLIEAGELCKVLDRRPAREPTARQLEAVELVAQMAARCLRMQWQERPAISEVVANLETALELARCDGCACVVPSLSTCAVNFKYDEGGSNSSAEQEGVRAAGSPRHHDRRAAAAPAGSGGDASTGDPTAGLDDTLREAHGLVMACQEKGAMYRLVMAVRQADKFRDVQSRIDSYLLVFPFISHIGITRRVDQIYSILLPNNPTLPSPPSSGLQSEPQDAEEVDWKVPHGVEVFTMAALAAVTNNFDTEIGNGGFGKVYKGCLTGGQKVAIKRMHSPSLQGENPMMEGEEAFRAEITILSSLCQKHIVKLYGCCIAGEERFLVYEYMKNGTLDDHLHGPLPSSSPVAVSWRMRIGILLGVSRAIEYLQSYAKRPVIHRDMTSSHPTYCSMTLGRHV
uniref:Protein kinase domain-containing protein n=1 Tax=Leersia perrieri TaxID=77586 RepID=A0A0D9XV22_9ORYZ